MAHVPRIYCDTELKPELELILPPAQSHHLAQVLRSKINDPLVIFNGTGGEYQAEIVELSRKIVKVKLDKFNPKNRNAKLKINLAIAIIKNDRFDWLLQKATELGVHSIQPLVCEYSNLRFKSAHLEKKYNHWHKIIINAAEQCGLNILPSLQPVLSFDTYCEEAKAIMVADPTGSKLSSEHTKGHDEVNLLIGPEGGFSPAELDLMQQNKFKNFNLGPTILRAETAAIAALSNLQLLKNLAND